MGRLEDDYFRVSVVFQLQRLKGRIDGGISRTGARYIVFSQFPLNPMEKY
jgi:hypothetical protein